MSNWLMGKSPPLRDQPGISFNGFDAMSSGVYLLLRIELRNESAIAGSLISRRIHIHSSIWELFHEQ